jgi:hypothetical protein
MASSADPESPKHWNVPALLPFGAVADQCAGDLPSLPVNLASTDKLFGEGIDLFIDRRWHREGLRHERALSDRDPD